MKNACIKSFNKFYDMDITLKEKQKGKNQDINVKDMGDYKIIKKQLAEKEKIKDELQKFKNFWRKLIKHFQNNIALYLFNNINVEKNKKSTESCNIM